MFRHLTVEAVRAIHAEVLSAHGGSAGLRDAALLESAVAAPQASFGGKPLMDCEELLPQIIQPLEKFSVKKSHKV